MRWILAEVSPAEFDTFVSATPAAAIDVLRRLGDALTGEDRDLRSATATFLTAVSRSHFERLGAKGAPWTSSEIDRLLTIQLADPARFSRDAEYRSRILEILPASIVTEFPGLRDRVLYELNRRGDLDFESFETLELSWQAVPRASSSRRVSLESLDLTYPDDSVRPIEASIFSLPSALISQENALSFVTALGPASEREIIIVADEPNLTALNPIAVERGITLLDSHARPYSPWPRDPFTIARSMDGRTVFVTRPNLQRSREEDHHMAREIVQGLSPRLDEEWGTVVWAEAPIPFHNGKILMTPDTVWIDIHTLEARNLQILELDSVPVSSFNTLEGIARYVEASRNAASELESFFGKRVKFAHPLPTKESLSERRSMMQTLAGGARHDLDSLVTILPGDPDSPAALVGDVSLGAELILGASSTEFSQFARGYGAKPSDGTRMSLYRAQSAHAASALDRYLDLVAEHLEGQGLTVRRLPLLVMPTSLLSDPSLDHDTFLITWNNVVLHGEGNARIAEGFASLFSPGDRLAAERFGEAGYRLELFPPLVRSIVLNGGYRCASNHLRR